MDPTQCYLEMFAAMRDGDLFTARQHALALQDWLHRGGFFPPNYSPHYFPQVCASRAACSEPMLAPLNRWDAIASMKLVPFALFLRSIVSIGDQGWIRSSGAGGEGLRSPAESHGGS
jgi:hypothetical protein